MKLLTLYSAKAGGGGGGGGGGVLLLDYIRPYVNAPP